MADEKNDRNGNAAVYVAWATFKRAIEDLAQGVPNVVDRSTFPGQSWGVQSQLLAGFKFLGLTDDDGKPTPTLHALAVPDEQTRKKKLEAILRERYADLFALDLVKTTPAELDAKMSESYKVTGDTREKATRFFLAAVEYLDIPISRLFKRTSGGAPSSGPRRRRASTSRRTIPDGDDDSDDDISPPSPPGTARTVTLKSGGTLTVSASLDVFKLSAADRSFLFGLIDKLEEYESANKEEPRPKRTPVTE